MDNWSKIEQLFHLALEQPAAKRRAYLDEACPDPEMRKSVESLLERADDKSFLEGSPVSRVEATRRMWGAGHKLGRFEIIELIGAGGMGEVYRARDSSLRRDVAVKAVRASVEADTDRLRRFEQEARLVGMLNHPNILAIHDIGVQDGSPYVVSELLEGETLRQRLRSGVLTPQRAIDIALQVARGLAAAHDKGITHRDLKPENLFLTKDGRVKILDFGLAKLNEAHTGEAAANESTFTMTGAGVVMGTPGYMAPEQITAGPIGPKTDIYAFGVVLFEMLTNQRPFHGSVADVISATLKDDAPDLSQLNPKLPRGLAQIVRHCLEKRPEDRFESVRDLAFALESLVGSTPVPAEKPARARRLGWIALAVVAAAVVGVAGVTIVVRRLRPETLPRFEPVTFRRGPVWAARFGPGKSLLYSAAWDGGSQEIYSTLPGNPESRSLDIGFSKLLAVSSTGEMAVLMRPVEELGVGDPIGTLARVPAVGGTPRELHERVAYADYSPAGDAMLLSYSPAPGIARLEYPAGHLVFEKNPGWLSYPRLSPKNDAIAFVTYAPGAIEVGTVMLLDLQSRATKALGDWNTISGLAWSADGSEIWVTAGTRSSSDELWALSASGKRRLVWRTSGSMRLHDIARNGQVLLTEDSWKGLALGVLPGDQRERVVSWLDGTIPAWFTPPGDALLFGEIGEGGGLTKSAYVRRTNGSAVERIGDGYPTSLSPDGKWALVTTRVPPPQHVYLIPTGAGDVREVSLKGIQFTGGVSDWLPDGRHFVLNAHVPGQQNQCYLADVTDVKPVAITPLTWSCRLVSPDGKSVLVMDPRSKLRTYPIGGGEARDVPDAPPGAVPVRWSSDPRVIYVVNHAAVYQFNVVTGHFSLWKELVPADPAGMISVGNFAVTPDGKHYAYYVWRLLSDLYVADGLK